MQLEDKPGLSTRALSQTVHRAVVPAAGFGTRLRPLTNAIPKEMLPIGRKPVLQHVVDELLGAGLTDILFVISPRKDMIRDYFGDGAKFGLNCHYVIQPEMKGLGDAVLRAEQWVSDEPFVVAFGDCLITGLVDSVAHSESPTQRLLSTHNMQGSFATVLTERVAREDTYKYGIVSPQDMGQIGAAGFKLKDIVEKPDAAHAPSNYAVAARWALNPVIFSYLHKASPSRDGEVNLTDNVRIMISDGLAAWAVPLQPGEARVDIGGWKTYLMAAARGAVEDPEWGEAVRLNINGNL